MKKLLCVVLCLLTLLSAIPALAEPVSEVMQVVNVNEYVSLREFPDTSSKRLEKVYLGELVTDCSATGNGFVRCTYDGKSGYVLAKYLKTTPFTNFDVVLKNQKVVNCTEWVSLRKTASTSAERLAKVPLGAAVTGCVKSGQFVYCEYKGQRGYILSQYLNNDNHSSTPQPSTVSAVMSVANCTSYVTLRKTPSTSAERVAKVHLGELVKVIGTAENGFIKCTYNGKTGYILAAYLKKTSFSASDTILPNQVVTNLSTWVALRKGPSTTTQRLEKVYLGEVVTKCVKMGSYVYCEYNGKAGYIYAKYLKNAY